MKNIVINFGNAYLFKEFCYPLIKQIKEMNNEFHLHAIIDKSNLPKNLINLANKLISSGLLESFEITTIYSKKGSVEKIIYHNRFINKLIKKKIDYLIVGEDSSSFMRLLIPRIQKQGGKVILILHGNMSVHYYRNLYKNNDNFNSKFNTIKIEESYATKIRIKISEIGLWKFFIFAYKFLINRILKHKLLLKYKEKINIFLDYKIFPFLLTGNILPSNNLFFSRDLTGFSDYTILFDQKEYYDIYTLLPSINNLFLAQHPIVGYCKNNKKTNDSTLLILVGGPSGFRVPNHKIQKWISAIQIVMKLKKPSQIHLRLHPRESKKVIMQFEKELSLNNIQYTTLNSKEISIIDNICSYMGVIGSPSLALKIFRWASKETFALCLEDATIPGFYGSILSLGDTEGIKNIDENTVIDSEILIPPKNFSFEKRVKLKDILRNILV